MTRLSLKLFSKFLIIALLAVHLPERAEAGADITDRELVSSRRVGRTVFEYSYQLSIDVNGPALDGLYVIVECDNPGTTIVDDRVDFGDVPGNQVTTSTDTFTIRQNRRIPFDPDCLVYHIGFEETLIISGVVSDMVIPFAQIIGTVDRTTSGRPVIDTSGRPVIETFTTTADQFGAYTIPMNVVSQGDFISVQAQGVGDLAGTVLTSGIGSVGSLHTLGAEGSIIVTSDDVGATNITHITTALDELVRRLNGGVAPNTDAELAALQAQVDGAELLELASLIKTIVDNPNVSLPPGYNNTLELIQDEAAADQALVDVQTNFPDEYQQAVEETAATLNLGFEPDEVIGTSFLVQPSEGTLNLGGFIFDLDANFGGSVIQGLGSSPVTWSIDAEGNVIVEVLEPIEWASAVFKDPPGFQVNALVSTIRYTIIRIAEGLTTDQVLLLRRTLTTFPNNPTIPDEIADDVPSPQNTYAAFGSDEIIPVEDSDIAGDTIALYYYHEDNESIGLQDPRFGADFLTFNANGTGTTARRGFDFSWSTDATGIISVVFDNGDTNTYALYNDGDVAKYIAIASLVSESGNSRSFAGEAIDYGGVDFTEANLVNRRYRQLGSVLDPSFIFEFVFLPDGNGCRLSPGQQRLIWELTPEGVVDTSLYLSFDNTIYQRRGFQLANVFPGILGDRYWLLESPDFGFPPVADIVNSPGRINAYEYIEDVTGQDPCGFQPTSLGVPFDSDNGGTGALFDLGTEGTALRVTGIDINVSYPVGTTFDVTVYTANVPYQNTLSSSVPGCQIFQTCIDTTLWNAIGTVQATAAGQEQPTFVDIEDIILGANTTTGIWVSIAANPNAFDELRYNNTVAPISIGDALLSMSFGGGVAGVSPSVVFETRIWNGRVYYELQR